MSIRQGPCLPTACTFKISRPNLTSQQDPDGVTLGDPTTVAAMHALPAALLATSPPRQTPDRGWQAMGSAPVPPIGALGCDRKVNRAAVELQCGRHHVRTLATSNLPHGEDPDLLQGMVVGLASAVVAPR